MHNISNVEGKDPIIRAIIFDTKGAASCDLKLLLYLKLVHFFKGLERYLKFLLLSHAILEVVSSLLKIPLTNLAELFLNLNQLVDNIMRLKDLLLENLDLFGDILTAASV